MLPASRIQTVFGCKLLCVRDISTLTPVRKCSGQSQKLTVRTYVALLKWLNCALRISLSYNNFSMDNLYLGALFLTKNHSMCCTHEFVHNFIQICINLVYCKQEAACSRLLICIKTPPWLSIKLFIYSLLLLSVMYEALWRWERAFICNLIQTPSTFLTLSQCIHYIMVKRSH